MFVVKIFLDVVSISNQLISNKRISMENMDGLSNPLEVLTAKDFP